MSRKHSARLIAYGPEDEHKHRRVASEGGVVDLVVIAFSFEETIPGRYIEESTDVTAFWRSAPQLLDELVDLINLRLSKAQEEGRQEIKRGLRELIGAARDEDV